MTICSNYFNAAIESLVRAWFGMGFAIPVSMVKKVVLALIEEGRYEHPWLGICGKTLALKYKLSLIL